MNHDGRPTALAVYVAAARGRSWQSCRKGLRPCSVTQAAGDESSFGLRHEPFPFPARVQEERRAKQRLLPASGSPRRRSRGTARLAKEVCW